MLFPRPRLGCLLALLALQYAHGHTTTTASSAPPAESSYTSPGTCRSATINYITQPLPQQCAVTSRPATVRPSSSSATTSTTAEAEYSSGKPVSSSSTSAESSTSTQSTEHTSPTTTIPANGASDTAEAASQEQSISGTTSSSEPMHTTIATSSTISEDAPTASADADADNEQDSPLDKANFLSFEEWKKQNLAAVGQSPEHVAHRSAEDMPRRARPDLDDPLDVLGEDSEISLDFSGFGPPTQQYTHQSRGPAERARQTSLASGDKPASQQTLRSKDAGRTCKERTNYASFDCAATVLKTNPECKSASSVLVENKDSYMLNICKVPNKFFIVELCDSILIDTVVLANYEFFSSIFRTFRLSVSDRYPVKQDKWRDLGVYDARNTRDVQAFLVEQPLIWARYLRIEILSHYGNEYYCPVSLLRVHGTTMMEEFRHQEEIARGEYSEAEEEVVEQEEPVVVVTSRHEPLSVPEDKTIETGASMRDTTSLAVDDQQTSTVETPAQMTSVSSQSEQASQVQTVTSTATTNYTQELPSNDAVGNLGNATQHNSSATETGSTQSAAASSQASSSGSSTPVQTSSATAQASNSTTSTSRPSDSASAHTSTSVSKASDSQSTSTAQQSSSSSSESTASAKPSTPSGESSKRPSATAPQAAVPSTQESFFKSISKRLSTLESNATLSLQYIESQSALLRDAFAKVEKRQVRKTEAFLSNLNATVSRELRLFREEYDLLWQSTIVELENQRKLYQDEILAVSERLNLLAGEVVFQKRVAVAQATLLVLCIGLVLFHRAGGVSVLDLPLQGKSPRYSSPAFWRRSVSPGRFDIDGDDTPSREVPDVRFEPATPGDEDVFDEEDEVGTPTRVVRSLEEEGTSMDLHAVEEFPVHQLTTHALPDVDEVSPVDEI